MAAAAFAFAVASAAGSSGPAGAQTVVPAPAVPLLPAAPIAAGPLSRSFAGAYQAINAARIADPNAALRATFLLTQARQRAARGDVAGALADSAAAQAAAISPIGAVPLAPALSRSPAFSVRGVAGAPAGAVPLADRGAALPVDLLVARNEIELVEQLEPGARLGAAKKHYRAGLDAYLSGNARKASSEANAAFDAAAAMLRKER